MIIIIIIIIIIIKCMICSERDKIIYYCKRNTPTSTNGREGNPLGIMQEIEISLY